MKKTVHVWHVEITDAEKIPSQQQLNPGYDLKKVDPILPEFNRFLYVAVGSAWDWYLRLDWTYGQWLAFLEKPDTEGIFTCPESGLRYREIDVAVLRCLDLDDDEPLPTDLARGKVEYPKRKRSR